MQQQPSNDVILRMECLKLACATALADASGDDIVKKAIAFVAFACPVKNIVVPHE